LDERVGEFFDLRAAQDAKTVHSGSIKVFQGIKLETAAEPGQDRSCKWTLGVGQDTGGQDILEGRTQKVFLETADDFLIHADGEVKINHSIILERDAAFDRSRHQHTIQALVEMLADPEELVGKGELISERKSSSRYQQVAQMREQLFVGRVTAIHQELAPKSGIEMLVKDQIFQIYRLAILKVEVQRFVVEK
jgi:hypothetical protein